MKRKLLITLLLCCLLVATISSAALAAEVTPAQALTQTAAQLQSKNPLPVLGSVGGEWIIIGLARSGADVPPAYYEAYYEGIVQTLQTEKGELTRNKYSEYSRLVLALTALGKDVTNVGGYNLLEKFADFDKLIKQGINGPVFALIALDSHDYAIPQIAGVKKPATRDLLLEYILAKEVKAADGTVGGFSLSGNTPDPDITGMVLQALSRYQDRPAVKAATDRALTVMSKMQDADGSFSSWGSQSSESVVQMLVALSALNIDVTKDARFVKGENNLVSALMSYYVAGGGFKHLLSGNWDGMASEQGLYALAAVTRQNAGKTALYDMRDVKITANPSIPATVTFSDINRHWAKANIEKFAAAGLVKGATATTFEPNRNIIRAEFVAIVVRALDLPRQTTEQYSDVANGAWYNEFIGAYTTYAKDKATTFRPTVDITREEAAGMIVQAALAGGLKNNLSEAQVTTLLSGFSDAATCDTALRADLAFAIDQGFLEGSNGKLTPKSCLTRAEAVTVISRLLAVIK